MSNPILVVQQDPETHEFFVQLPDSFLTEQDWRAGDRLHYSLSAAAEVLVTNESKKQRTAQASAPLFVDETRVSHRIRYAVRAQRLGAAKTAIENNEEGLVGEFDQNCLGERIFSVREVSVAEYLQMTEHPTDPQLKLGLIANISASVQCASTMGTTGAGT